MSEICIVSVGVDGREKYSNKVLRVKNASEYYEYPNIVWINSYPPNSPSHQEVNHAFKAHAIEYARSLGHKKILWLDSVTIPNRKLDKINSILDEYGYFFVYEGYDVGSWCKDEALSYLNITRDESFNIPQIATKHFGLNFNFKESVDFFNQFYTYATTYGKQVFHGPVVNVNNSASSDPRVRGHRHDQIVASVIVNKMNLVVSSNDMICWTTSKDWNENLIDKNNIELVVS